MPSSRFGDMGYGANEDQLEAFTMPVRPSGDRYGRVVSPAPLSEVLKIGLVPEGHVAYSDNADRGEAHLSDLAQSPTTGWHLPEHIGPVDSPES